MRILSLNDIPPSEKKTIDGVVIETYPLNPDMKSFHSRKPIEHKRGNVLGCFRLEYPQDAMIQECELAAKILLIQGVSKVSLHGRYQIAVEKAMAFNWDELEPQIIAAVQDYNQTVPPVEE